MLFRDFDVVSTRWFPSQKSGFFALNYFFSVVPPADAINLAAAVGPHGGWSLLWREGFCCFLQNASSNGLSSHQ